MFRELTFWCLNAFVWPNGAEAPIPLDNWRISEMTYSKHLIITTTILPSAALRSLSSFDPSRILWEWGYYPQYTEEAHRGNVIWLMPNSWRRKPKSNPGGDDSKLCAFTQHGDSYFAGIHQASFGPFPTSTLRLFKKQFGHFQYNLWHPDESNASPVTRDSGCPAPGRPVLKGSLHCS